MFRIAPVKISRATGSANRTAVVCSARHGRKNERMNYEEDDDQYFNHGYSIFQSNISKTHITLYDVKDAIDCCSSILDERMKSSCYQQFGVDGGMAEKYYKRVESMERQYHIESIDEPIIPGSVYSRDAKAIKKPMRKWFPFGNGNGNDDKRKK